ncbi:unnamed protein product [Owenia fusiformis]|uniref:Uncharacterized protein n=1 Tax=Owenia fusiformis TaxID=6347 RepID=A0A8J1U7A3_OWEFU|nr:unnamed protein product [Owenia fusiformis]
MISNTTLGIVAATGLAFVGYCVYFDRKRRSDPLFKQKLRERRRKNNKGGKGKSSSSGGTSQFPDLRDTDAMQKFFLEEVQLGEQLLGEGDIEGGVEHLSNAVAVCGQPQHLLSVLQQTLPPQVFQLLIQRLPAVSQKIVASAGGGGVGPAGAAPMGMSDDIDLE